MKLTNNEIFFARNAVAGIDKGYVAKDKDGKAQTEPFKLSGLVRLRLGRLHKRLEEECGVIEKTRTQLQVQHKIGGENQKSEDVNAFLTEWNAVLGDSKEFDALPQFTHADLQIESGANNEYPVTVLSGLAPFIKEEVAK